MNVAEMARLSNFSGMRPDDIALTAQEARRAVAHYGLPPSDAPLVAAHEAGHMIVGLAMGGQFEVCQIARLGCDWIGYTSVFRPGVHTAANEAKFDVREQPRRAFLTLPQHLGGLAAEVVIGRFHPASSLEEVIHAIRIVKTIAAVLDVRPETVWGLAFGFATSLIQRNRHVFDVACTRLRERRRVSATDARRMISRLQTITSANALAQLTRAEQREKADRSAHSVGLCDSPRPRQELEHAE